jgi:hypothetical protein
MAYRSRVQAAAIASSAITTKKDWGPHLWKIFHSIAERIGNQKVEMLAADELREFVHMLSLVDKIMPCSLCATHFREWSSKHPIRAFSNLRGATLKDAARKWFFDLHEEVNKRNEVVTAITIEVLPDIYKQTNIREEWNTFLTKIKANAEMGMISQKDLTEFSRHLGALRKLIGA